MATCPHCGDPGAPTRGWCLVCGSRVDGAPAAARAAPAAVRPRSPAEPRPGDPADAGPHGTDALAFDDDEETSSPPNPSPPRAAVRPGLADEPPAVEAQRSPDSDAAYEPEGAPSEEPPTVAAATGDGAANLTADDLASDATQPHAAIALRARYEMSAVPGDDPPLTGVLVEITTTGTPLREGVQGPVAHVIVALDVSASMNTPDKFPVLRAAVAQMLADLAAPGAAPVLVSFIVFAKGAAVIARDVPASKVRAQHLFDTIRRHPLCFTRYTDVAGALDRAGRIAYDQTVKSRTLPVRIYLLTDGRPQDVARARASVGRCAKVPCDLNALAFGADADVRVLQDLLSGRRGGTVKSVRRATLGDAFERIAEVAQTVVATQCRVGIELAPGVVGGAAFRYRPARVRFPDPAFEAGKRFHTDLGTIESGRVYSLLFEVRPPETDEASSRLGTLTVTIPSYGGPIVSKLDLVLARTTAGGPPGVLDRDVRAARDILDALDAADPQAALRALRLRRRLYESERRDPGLLAILDRAVELLKKTGSLTGLTPGEHATLLAHTCTSGFEREPAHAGGARARR